MGPSKEVTYLAYVLRVWRERAESPGHPAVWRFSLEDINTRQRHGFGNLEALMAFLQQQVGAGDQGLKTPDQW